MMCNADTALGRRILLLRKKQRQLVHLCRKQFHTPPCLVFTRQMAPSFGDERRPGFKGPKMPHSETSMLQIELFLKG